MYLNPFKAEEALPLRERRMWRKPRCDAYAVSDANNPTHMGASSVENFIANSNAVSSAAFATNNGAASTPSSI